MNIKCPRCGKRDFYYRLTTKDFKCRKCPCVFCVEFKTYPNGSSVVQINDTIREAVKTINKERKEQVEE